MDNLVLTGTLSLIAFFAIVIAGILAVLFFVLWLWGAAGAGDYGSILVSFCAIFLAVCIYTGAGYYFFSKGWI